MSQSPDAAGAPRPQEAPRVQLVSGQNVGLGCGTLVLIGVIVWFVSGMEIKSTHQEVQKLRSDVGELRKAIDAQTSVIRNLEKRLDAGKAKE